MKSCLTSQSSLSKSTLMCRDLEKNIIYWEIENDFLTILKNKLKL